MKRDKTGIYATVNFVEIKGKVIAIIYGNPNKRRFIESLQKTDGTEKAFKLAVNDLGFDSSYFPEDEISSIKETNRLQLEGKDVWEWSSSPQHTDPIRLMFDSSIAFYKA